MTNNKSIEGIIERRLRWLKMNTVSIPKLAELIASDIKNQYKVVAQGEFSDEWIIEKDNLLLGYNCMKRIGAMGYEGKQIEISIREL